MPVVVRGFFRPAPVDDGHGEHGGPGSTKRRCSVCCRRWRRPIGGIVLFFYAGDIWQLLMGMVP